MAEFSSQKLPDGTTVFTHPTGTTMKVTHFPNGVAVHTCHGNSLPELAPIVIADCDDLIRAHGKCTVFVDGRNTLQMFPEFRLQMTAFFKSAGDKVSVHFLQNSKLLVMAVSIANLALRHKVSAYSDYGKWREAIEAHAGKIDERLIQLHVERPRAGS
jgi:hypothetical protein